MRGIGRSWGRRFRNEKSVLSLANVISLCVYTREALCYYWKRSKVSYVIEM